MVAIEYKEGLPFGIGLRVSETAKEMGGAFFYPRLSNDNILIAGEGYFDRFFRNAIQVISENDRQIEMIPRRYSFDSVLTDYALSDRSGSYAISLISPEVAAKFEQELDRYMADLEKKKTYLESLSLKGRAKIIYQILLDLAGMKNEEISGMCAYPYEKAKLGLTALGVGDWTSEMEYDLEIIGRLKVETSEPKV